MTKRLLLLIGTTIAVMVFVAAPAGAASTVFHTSFKGHFALADFEHKHGCVVTDAEVFVSTGVVRSAGQASAVSDAEVFVAWENICTGRSFFAEGDRANLPAGAFVMRHYDSAALTVSIRATDGNGHTVTIRVSVGWTGAGRAVPTTQRDSFHTADFREVDRSTSTVPASVSAAGSIVLGSTNYAPNRAAFAVFGTAKSGEINVSKS